MKNILKKVALSFLSVSLIVMLSIDTYMLFIMYKISDCRGIFSTWKVVSDYKVLDNIQYAVLSMLLTIILLVILFGFIIKEFIKNKKV